MQLANIISSNTFKRVSFPYYLQRYTELCVYFAYQAVHTFLWFPPPPCLLQHLSRDSFKAPVFTNLETGREKPHPCSVSSHPLSTDDLSPEMALFLFKFSSKSFHNTLSCHLFLMLLFNTESHNCIYYRNFIPSGSPWTPRNMLL